MGISRDVWVRLCKECIGLVSWLYAYQYVLVE